MHYKIYGDVKVSTGDATRDKRAAVRNRHKIRKLKITDKQKYSCFSCLMQLVPVRRTSAAQGASIRGKGEQGTASRLVIHQKLPNRAACR